MSASAPEFAKSWRTGVYTVSLVVPPLEQGKAVSAVIEWSPNMPRKPLSGSERRAYRRGRDAAIAELSAKLQISVALLEL